MATPDPTLQSGARLGDEARVFRAFAEKNFRERRSTPPHVVRYWAFLLRDDDVADGLSVGLTPAASVKHLSRNQGYGEIPVSAITSMPDDLYVKRDAEDREHAFICNLPLMTISAETRKEAMRIAKELARRTTAITCNPI